MDALDQFVLVSERRNKSYLRLKKSFDEFRTSAIAFFDGKNGHGALPWILASGDKEPELLSVAYLGRRFTLEFSVSLLDNNLVGNLVAYEKDTHDQNVARRVASILFQTNSEVSDLPSYSDGDPVYLGSNTADTIYITLQLLEQAIKT
jgi:hypothetical protein